MARQEVDYYGTKTFEFTVTNLSVSSAWGGLYYNTSTFDTDITLTGKKIFVSFNKSGESDAIPYLSRISGTSVVVGFVRGTSGTISGAVYVEVRD